MERLIKRIVPVMLILIMIFSSGCSFENVVITTDFDRTELMRINDTSTYLPEYMLYLTTVQNQYERIYGQDVWSQEYGSVSLESRVKDKVIAELAQVKVMNLMAADYGLSFTDEEHSAIEKVASEFFNSLTETEKEKLGLTYEICLNAYLEYAMAKNVYEYIIKDVNPEISDDEARTVTIQQIFVKTYNEGADGKKVPYSERSRKEAREKIEMALELSGEEGSSFESIQAKYNEGSETVRTFGRGVVEPEIEEVSFNLSTNQISDIVETADGFYILKCISNFEIEETQVNKITLLNMQKEQVFEDTYNKYLESITKSLNSDLFEATVMLHDPEIKTSDFFERINWPGL